MRHAVLFDGMPGDAGGRAVAGEIRHALVRAGWRVRHEPLHARHLRPCLQCAAEAQCATSPPARCLVPDDVLPLAAAWAGADLVVLATPIVRGGDDALISRLLARLRPLVAPVTDAARGGTGRPRRTSRRGHALLAIGCLEAPNPVDAASFVRGVEHHANRLGAAWHDALVLPPGPRGPALRRALVGLLAHAPDDAA